LIRDSKTVGRNPSLSIRRATLTDADAIARIQYLSHTTAFRAFVPAAWVATRDIDTYRRAWRERLLAAGELVAWVALEGDDVVGTISAIRLPDDAAEGGKIAAIRSCHVHPERIGLGIGSQLWGCVESFLRESGFACARLDIIAANARARRFFEGVGCRVVAALPLGVEGVPIVTCELKLSDGAAYRHPTA
jgi:ribosomal protein S18 acetylase RimI-like enzyme